MEVLSTKKVKTRKQHTCFACLRKFEAGTEMQRQVIVFDGIDAIYSCDTCESLFHYHNSYFFDYIEGVYHEGCVNDAIENNETPEELLTRLDSIKS